MSDEAFSMETVNVKWTGTRPLLLHNERLANPLDPIAKQMSALTSRQNKERKTEAAIEALARLEWEGGLYLGEDGEPVVPTWNLLATIREGARLSRRGKQIERAVLATDESTPILYKGPRKLDAMWAAKDGGRRRFVDIRSVGVQTSRVMRTRPLFVEWALDFALAFDPRILSRETLVSIMVEAGQYVGLGEFRPRFGRFTVAVT